ncbi:MAG TPA: Gfo/Idh/MocA family oxidoreductase [Phototrophicaceae bacterium]|nr:Gfo/Idh/MocA family oxidoreductase [Phototrophicaceae bacterium]
MAAQRLRVGVIGCGTVAQIMHLPYLRSLPDLYQIAAISDLSPGLLRYIGETYGVPENRRYSDYHDLVASDLDAVLVLSGGSHAPQVIAAAEAGKNILVEKPLCFTVREADEIIAAVNKANVKLMVAYMKRYDPGYKYAQKLVKSMPDIHYVQINTLHPSEEQYWNIHGVTRFADVPKSVIQPLMDEKERLLDEAIGHVSETLRFIYEDSILGSMVHDINAIRGLIGEPEGVVYTDIWPEGEKLPSTTTILKFPHDIRAVYTWTFLADLRDYFEEIALMSPANRLRIQFPSPFLKHFPTPIVFQGMEDGAAFKKVVEASYDEAFREELKAFHDCVVNDQQPITDAEDGKKDVAILQQVVAALHPAGLGGEAAKALS